MLGLFAFSFWGFLVFWIGLSLTKEASVSLLLQIFSLNIMQEAGSFFIGLLGFLLLDL